MRKFNALPIVRSFRRKILRVLCAVAHTASLTAVPLPNRGSLAFISADQRSPVLERSSDQHGRNGAMPLARSR